MNLQRMKASLIIASLMSFPLFIASCDEEVKPSTSNTTTTTTSSEEAEKFHVIFQNYDEKVLFEVDVVKGETAIYGGADPTKEEDDEFTYEFTGWDKELENVTVDFTTIAQFKEVPKENWGPIHWF